ncbi:ABC transporter permease [Candidatus Woesearchaeota archaeon]|nr:ABC transporter permease [Candidatus Woesearchaeota archaeon]
MMWDYFRLAFKGVKARKIRSWLTMIGIFIGVTAVVALISLGQGLQDSINEEFNKLGKNRLTVAPGGGAFLGPTSSNLAVATITEDDLDVLNRINGVDSAAGVLSKNARLEFKDEVDFINVWGFPTDKDGENMLEGISFFEIEKGRQLRSGDKYKAVIGYSIAKDTFDKEITVGSKLKIKNKIFEAVGIQKKAGTGVHDVIVRIPLETAREIYDEPEEFSTIFVLTKDGYEPADIVDEIKKELRDSREVEEGEEDFSVQTAEQTGTQLNQILDIVNIVIIGIAAISLLVGGIGIMNTMYTTVMERTSEIGVMKSVGARNSQIMFLFLVESGLLGLVGGLIGLILGLGIAKLGELLAVSMGVEIFKIHVGGYLIVGALLISFLAGTLSGLLPARQAAMMQPVDALRKND